MTKTLMNCVTEKPKTKDALWLVSAEWLGGHDKRKFVLENVFKSLEEAEKAWARLTPENHAKSYGYAPNAECGFLRHPIRVFKESA